MNRSNYGRPQVAGLAMLFMIAGYPETVEEPPSEASALEVEVETKPFLKRPPVVNDEIDITGCLGDAVLEIRDEVTRKDKVKVELAIQLDELTDAFVDCAQDESAEVDLDLLERDYRISGDDNGILGGVTVRGPLHVSLRCADSALYDHCSLSVFQKADYPSGDRDAGFVNIIPVAASTDWRIGCSTWHGRQDGDNDLFMSFELGVDGSSGDLRKEESLVIRNENEEPLYWADNKYNATVPKAVHWVPDLGSLTDLEDEIHPFYLDGNPPQFFLPDSRALVDPGDSFHVFLEEIGGIVNDFPDSDAKWNRNGVSHPFGDGGLQSALEAMRFPEHSRVWFYEEW